VFLCLYFRCRVCKTLACSSSTSPARLYSQHSDYPPFADTSHYSRLLNLGLACIIRRTPALDFRPGDQHLHPSKLNFAVLKDAREFRIRPRCIRDTCEVPVIMQEVETWMPVIPNAQTMQLLDVQLVNDMLRLT